MQMPAAVESVGNSEGLSGSQLSVSENAPQRADAFSGLRLSNPS